jgi:hypothetical protein
MALERGREVEEQRCELVEHGGRRGPRQADRRDRLEPRPCTMRSATQIPSVTPAASSIARLTWRPWVTLRTTIAAIGAKNGRGWRTSWLATSHAPAAATELCAMTDARSRRHCSRWANIGRRIPTA